MFLSSVPSCKLFNNINFLFTRVQEIKQEDIVELGDDEDGSDWMTGAGEEGGPDADLGSADNSINFADVLPGGDSHPGDAAMVS